MRPVRKRIVPFLIIAACAAVGGWAAWILPIGARQPSHHRPAVAPTVATTGAQTPFLVSAPTRMPAVPPASPNPEPPHAAPVALPTIAEPVEDAAVTSAPSATHPADDPQKAAMGRPQAPRRSHAIRARAVRVTAAGKRLPKLRAGALSSTEF